MKSLNDMLTSGRINRPQRGIIYGVEGVGKTALATECPQPVLIDTESGSHQYSCQRITVGNDRQLEEAIHALLTESNEFMTVIIDSVDWAERYLLSRICRDKKVESISDFPHGTGYVLLRESFEKFLTTLDGFIRLGKHVILVGHAQVKTVQLPGISDPFERFELKLDKRNSDTATEWADFQLFLNWDIRTSKSRDGSVRAVGGHERLIYPAHTVSCDAKNRLGLIDPVKCAYGPIAGLFNDILTAADDPARSVETGSSLTSNSSAVPHNVTQDMVASAPDPDLNPTEPFLSDAEIKTAQTILQSLPADKLVAFLRTHQKIGPNDDQTALGPHYLRKVMANPAKFRETVLATSL
jgi:AAA domain